jgi:iron complex outermembrane receptor protein
VEHVVIDGTPAATDTRIAQQLHAAERRGGRALHRRAGVKLGLTFSSTGRAPALTELFARGGHDGPNTYETGDPNLKIERANSLEASLRIHRGRFKFDGSLYSSWFTNYIYGDLTGRMCDDGGVCAMGAMAI